MRIIDPVLSRFVPFDFFFHFANLTVHKSLRTGVQLVACLNLLLHAILFCHLVMWALCPFLSAACMQKRYWLEAFPAEIIGTSATFVVPKGLQWPRVICSCVTVIRVQTNGIYKIFTMMRSTELKVPPTHDHLLFHSSF